MCFSPQRRAIFRQSELQKVLRRPQFFNMFTSKCAFRYSGVQFFRHQNVQKCSEDHSFLTFSLPNVLFATAAYNFWTSERPKVLPDPQFFNIFTSECVFHHSGVQFFDIVTSKRCSGHFRFKMFFSPQRRAIFDLSADHLTPHPPL